MMFGAHAGWAGVAALAWVCIFQALGRGLWRALWRGCGGVGEELPGLLVLFFQQTLGMGAAMALLLLLAVCGFFNWPGLCVGLGLALLAAGLARRRAPGRVEGGVARWEWGALACAALLSAAVSWRFPGAWDDTSYHLPLARTIVEQHALAANEWLRFPYFPAFMHLLFAAGLMVDAWLAQWLATWPVVVTLIGLMGAARWLCGHALWGVLAWAWYLYTPALEHSLGFAYVDAALALFCMAAVAAVALWGQRQGSSRRWLALAGVCAGVAAGIKFHGLVVAAALGLAVLALELRGGRVRAALAHLLAFGLPCVGVCVFWYARSYWVTGDPLHPAGARVFGYYLWNAEDLAFQVAEQATHGVPKHWVNFLQGIWQAKAPYVYAIFGVPLLLTGPRARAWGVAGLAVWVVTLFWFWVSQVDRYLMPVLPLAALLCLGVLLRLARWAGLDGWAVRGLPRWGGAALALACAAGMAGWSVAGLLQRPSIERQRDAFPEIALLRRAEELAGQYGGRVLNVGYENAFYFYQGQLIGDWFGRAAFRRFTNCDAQYRCRMRPPEEVARAMRELDARMVLINSRGFPFDEAQYSARMTLLGRSGAGFLYGLR